MPRSTSPRFLGIFRSYASLSPPGPSYRRANAFRSSVRAWLMRPPFLGGRWSGPCLVAPGRLWRFQCDAPRGPFPIIVSSSPFKTSPFFGPSGPSRYSRRYITREWGNPLEPSRATRQRHRLAHTTPPQPAFHRTAERDFPLCFSCLLGSLGSLTARGFRGETSLLFQPPISILLPSLSVWASRLFANGESARTGCSP